MWEGLLKVVVPGVTILGGIIKIVTVFMSDPIEVKLETDTQKTIRHIINITVLFVILFILGASFLGDMEIKNEELFWIILGIFLLAIFIDSFFQTIQSLRRAAFTENNQQKMIIIKRMENKNFLVLPQSNFYNGDKKKQRYQILAEEKIEGKYIYIESLQEAIERQYLTGDYDLLVRWLKPISFLFFLLISYSYFHKDKMIVVSIIFSLLISIVLTVLMDTLAKRGFARRNKILEILKDKNKSLPLGEEDVALYKKISFLSVLKESIPHIRKRKPRN